MKFDYREIIRKVNNHHLISRLLLVTLGSFLLAINYNVFFLQNNLVVGGTSGLATVIEKVFSIPSADFILVTSILLIIVSFAALGREQTSRTIVGALLYPLFVRFTLPLAQTIIPYVKFDSMFLIVLVSGLIFGLANGIIYKTGFSTGGMDVIIQIVNKYLNVPTGKSVFATNIFVICLGGVIFGLKDMLYSIILLVISSNLIDRILIGISDSKMFFIYTKKTKEVENFIIDELKSGVTIFKAEGGFTKSKNKMLMCVVPTRDYYLFKESILLIDKDAFFVINDCYEVSGGVKRSNLPFI